MNDAEKNETLGILEALAVAVDSPETWHRVSSWNITRKNKSVADVLTQVAELKQQPPQPTEGR